MARGWLRPVACVISCSILATAAAQDWEGREQINATLWMQRAPEFRAITEQTYRLAALQIAAPAPGSAALEQQGVAPEVLARMPTAVVLDIDETVLDNTVYQARLLRERAEYDTRSWGQWVGAGQADAVPGAREFIAAARRLGHTVFYVSNRDCAVPPPTATDPCPAKTATMRNLVALGIEPAPDPARMLLRGERPEWKNSLKTLRRQFIAANYRIVALVGDDLGDFVEPKVFAGDRERLEPRFGVSWFLLPNPVYGSWTNPYGTLEQKYAGLRTEAPVLELPGGGAVAPRCRPRAHRELERRIPDDPGDAPWHCAATARSRAAWWAAMTGLCPAPLRGANRAAPPTTPRCAATPRRWPPTSWRCRRSMGRKRRRWCSRATTTVSPRALTRRRTASPSGAGCPYRCENEYEPLSIDNAVRRGVVATFFPGTSQEFRLMSVHLKSGCPAGPLTAEGRNCDLLSRQIAPLEAWIDEQARAGSAFRPAR